MWPEEGDLPENLHHVHDVVYIIINKHSFESFMCLDLVLNLTEQQEDVPLVEFMYLVFTCIPSESYCRQLRSSSFFCTYVFQMLIISKEAAPVFAMSMAFQ